MQLLELYHQLIEWTPSKAQRKAFAQKMQDPDERAAYEKRTEDKLEKQRSKSKFDYSTAGGSYVPTKAQHDFTIKHPELFATREEEDAMNMVQYGYTTQSKIKHDYIHIVNDKIRSNP